LRELTALAPMLRAFLPEIAIAAAFTVVAACLTFCLPAAVGYVIDRILPGEDTSLLVPILALVALAYSVRAGASWARERLSFRVGEQVKREMGERLLGHLLGLDRATLQGRDRGALAERAVTDVGRLDSLLVGPLLDAAEQIVTLCVGVGVLLLVSPRLALVAAIALPLQALAHVIFVRGIGRRARDVRVQRGALQARVFEDLAGLEEIRQNLAETRRVALLGRQWGRVAHANERFLATVAGANAVSGLVGALATLAVIGGGGWLVVAGRISLGDLVSFVAVLGILYGPVQQLGGLRRGMEAGLVSLHRVQELLALRPARATSGGCEAVADEPDELTLHDVYFEYEPGTPVLQGTSLSLKRGGITALIGPSGEGKSTLGALLTRLETPRSGRITLDGVDLAELDAISLRQLVAVVPQSPTLFAGTIHDNIALGLPRAGRALVSFAARLAHADGFIRRLPDGYETLVGPGGVELSGGQLQRIALARALIRDPQILVLDEPTSALDPATEQAVLLTLRRWARGRIVLLITHRTSSAVVAERVAVMREGRIQAVGPFDSLVSGEAWASLNSPVRELPPQQCA